MLMSLVDEKIFLRSDFLQSSTFVLQLEVESGPT